VNTETLLHSFAADVARDLERSPRQLQSRYLYDALGSSLFDAICRLPWYRITRAEDCLLARHAIAVASRLQRANDLAIAELGVGTGEKLATLLEALPASGGVAVHLVDISAAALDAAAARISGFPGVAVQAYQDPYEQGLLRVAAATRGVTRRLVLFLGSNIGNFDAPAALDLMRAMRRAVQPGDLLLLGADLVKPEPELMLAYDDPLGVTAAFNKNLLVRINRELGGDFDLSAFRHRAVWNASEHRVEMHLVSERRQEVRIAAAGIEVSFAAGEAIWTESSYKFTEEAIAVLGASAQFAAVEQWVEPAARFALTLFEAR
jgi:dimethylhistidine N-methyltransferase